jgi:hypothetical protein
LSRTPAATILVDELDIGRMVCAVTLALFARSRNPEPPFWASMNSSLVFEGRPEGI